MEHGVRVRISVKPYRWKEFVHDVCYVLYATIMISNALCKRYFHRSIPQAYHCIYDPVARFFTNLETFLKTLILILIVIFIGFFGLLFTAVVPILLILDVLGKIN